MATSTEVILSEVFSGSGNHQEDARAIAEIRYESWRKELKKKKRLKFQEVEKTYSYDEKNSVYCKCSLTVSYSLTPIS